LEKRLSMAKKAINLTWRNFFSLRDVDLTVKNEVYKSTVRSIITYASQIWGFERYESVEQIQRYFIKKIYGLPKSSPNYMIMIEFNLNDIFGETLKLHLKYIRRTLQLTEDRLPKKIAEMTINKEIYWFAALKDIMSFFNVDIPFHGTDTEFRIAVNSLLNKINENSRIVNLQQASWSSHGIYSKLAFSNSPSYVKCLGSKEMIRMIFKVRGGMIGLNGLVRWNVETSECTICNLRETEDIEHFIAKCPLMSGLRNKYLGRNVLGESEMLDVLRGSNWIGLYGFVVSALKYRMLIVSEFD
jgi:hypothetical protein